MFSSRTVKPAARAWPPKPSSRSLHCCQRAQTGSRRPRSGRSPSPCPSSRQIINAGQPYRSVRREATMPTTPWCQLRIGQQRRAAASGGLRSSQIHALPQKISPSMACRSRFRAHSSWASGWPRSRSLVRRSSSRHLGPAHPAGGVDPGRQGVADGGGGDGLVLQPRLPDQQGQAQPAGVGRAPPAPGRTMVRFSPVIGITSATVPTAARSAVLRQHVLRPLLVRRWPWPASGPPPRRPGP